MPLPKDIVQRLASGEMNLDLDVLPTLNEEVFPDSLEVWEVGASGGENGKKLHKILDIAGLSKGQRAGMTHLLGSFAKIGDEDITIGDIRALTEEELMRLRGEFKWGKPTADSVRKIKKLFG